MGTRIHKVLGYGLKDLKYKDGFFKDTRLNIENLRAIYDGEVDAELLGLYKNFLASKEDFESKLELSIVKESNHLSFYNAFRSSPYGGKILVIQPLSHRDWHRYDNIIDYEESGHLIKDKVKILRSGIYPYINFWDSRDGRVVKGDVACAFYRSEKSIFFEELGFATLEECKQFLQPAVPKIIQGLCEFSEIFNDPKTIYTLKPMVFTYWS